MRQVKPLRSPCFLNRSHKHAKGLKAAYLFNDNSTKVWDFTRNGNVLDITNASWVADGLQCDANGEYASLDNSNGLLHSSGGSMIMYIKSYIPLSGIYYNYIFGRYTGSNGDFAVYKYSTNVYFITRSSTTTSYVRYVASDFPDWQTGFQLGVHWKVGTVLHDGKNMALTVNGEYITPNYATSGASSLASYALSNTLYVLNNVDNTTEDFNGLIKSCFIYNKTLSESTSREIYKDQYAMFYNPSNIYLNLLNSFKPGVLTHNNYYGANAFPIGRGL